MDAEQSGKQPAGWSEEELAKEEDGDATKKMITGKAESDNRYHAYLLRCWQEGNSWRYSVETAGDEQERRGFGSLESLLAWLGANLK